MTTSSPKPEPEVSTEFSGLSGDGGSPSVRDALSQTQQELEVARNARTEERFVWIMVTVILVDVLWFRNAQNPTIPVVVLVLELVLLLVLAKRMGVPELLLIFERIISRIGQTGGGG